MKRQARPAPGCWRRRARSGRRLTLLLGALAAAGCGLRESQPAAALELDVPEDLAPLLPRTSGVQPDTRAALEDFLQAASAELPKPQRAGAERWLADAAGFRLGSADGSAPADEAFIDLLQRFAGARCAAPVIETTQSWVARQTWRDASDESSEERFSTEMTALRDDYFQRVQALNAATPARHDLQPFEWRGPPLADAPGAPGAWVFGARLGSGPRKLALITHLDTVAPIRDDWQPFEARLLPAELEGSVVLLLRGRGAIDDKGPAATALALLDVLRAAFGDSDLLERVTIEALCDTSEETGASVPVYLAATGAPSAGVVLDADWAVYAEKGGEASAFLVSHEIRPPALPAAAPGVPAGPGAETPGASSAQTPPPPTAPPAPGTPADAADTVAAPPVAPLPAVPMKVLSVATPEGPTNQIPDQASALLLPGTGVIDDDLLRLDQARSRYRAECADASRVIDVTPHGGGEAGGSSSIRIRARGWGAAHASAPQVNRATGHNPLACLCQFLAFCHREELLADTDPLLLPRFLAFAFGHEVFGEQHPRLLAAQDEIFTDGTTYAVTRLFDDIQTRGARVDVRYALGHHAREWDRATFGQLPGASRFPDVWRQLTDAFNATLPSTSPRVTFLTETWAAPDIKDRSSAAWRSLMSAYERAMGRPALERAIGGGTDAKGFPTLLACGPNFGTTPTAVYDAPLNYHGIDESVPVQHLLDSSRVLCVWLAVELHSSP